MTEARHVRARWELPSTGTLTLTPQGPPEAGGAIDAWVDGGDPGLFVHCEHPGTGPCQGAYPLGAVVRLSATPYPGSVFLGWDGDCAAFGSATECQVTMTTSLAVGALFDGPKPLTVTLAGANGAQGVVEAWVDLGPPGSLIHCEYPAQTSCEGLYQIGSLVRLYASPLPGSVFAGWAGACAAFGPAPECQVTITDAVNAVAQFDGPRTLTVTLAGANGAQGAVDAWVDLGPPGSLIHCEYPAQTSCQGLYQIGTLVRLNASPLPGSVFAGWGGACAAFGTAPECQVTITDAVNAVAQFDGPRTLTVTLAGVNGAQGVVDAWVDLGPPGSAIHCEYPAQTSCQGLYQIGTLVRLNASPLPGSVFAGWAGACLTFGTAPECQVTIDAAKAVTATFALDPTLPVPVAWTSAAGVSVTANSLTKTAPNGWGNAGAISSQQLAAGEGYVEFTATETNTYRMLGLSNGSTGFSYQEIDFAIELVGNGQIAVFENGIQRAAGGPYASGDKLRIAVVGTQVQYSKNGIVFRVSSQAVNYPLLVDTSLYNASASLADAVVSGFAAPPPVPPSSGEPVVWTSVAGVTASANSLTKTAPNGWTNGGAVSSQQLSAGEGYVEFTATETNTYRMLGLSNGSTSASYQEIDFAIELVGNGQIAVFENGVQRAAGGAYTSGDKLRIAVVGTRVEYSRNRVVFHVSAQTINYPLLVDTSLYNTASTLASAVVSGFTAAPPQPPSVGDPVVWTSPVGVSISGNSLTKTATNGWSNGGAVSTQQIASGDGYVEFTAAETNTYRMLGLSNGSASASYQEIDFAIELVGNGQIAVFENGVQKAAGGSYAQETGCASPSSAARSGTPETTRSTTPRPRPLPTPSSSTRLSTTQGRRSMAQRCGSAREADLAVESRPCAALFRVLEPSTPNHGPELLRHPEERRSRRPSEGPAGADPAWSDPRGAPGPTRGMKWVVGAGTHGCWLGSYEYPKRRAMERLIKRGAVVYDIGANVGYYTLLSSVLVGAEGRVLAFEPLPRNLAYLRRHIEMNRLLNVSAIPMALGDRPGIARFRTAADHSMGSLAEDGSLTVQVGSLDDLAGRAVIPEPDIIKMDIEGGELAALRGAQTLLARCRPRLFLATHGSEVHHACCNLLSALGYQLSSLDGKPVPLTDEVIATAGDPG